MNGTIRIHQTKSLISGRNTLSPQDMAPMYILARDIDDRKTTAAMRLRLIRTYDIVQSRYSDRTGEYWVPCIILELDCNFIDWYYLSCISGRCNKKVPTRIPKEIVSLVGRGMLFKINVERDRLEKRNLAFPVMQIKDDIAVVNEYCPGMLKEAKQKSTNSEEPLDDEFDSDEGFFSDEEAESPLPNPLSQVAKGCSNDSEAVKRRLLDEFSSTQVSKKKTHLVQIKVEKDSGLAVDQNSQNIEI
nr:putative transposase [Ipomoea batatas]